MLRLRAWTLAALFLLSTEDARARERPPTVIGTASWYGYHWAGRKMADGRRYDPLAMTAASRTLPFGLRVRVTNLANGRTVIVTIEDRGPYVGARVLDLSLGAARALDMVDAGLARVMIEALEQGCAVSPQDTCVR